MEQKLRDVLHDFYRGSYSPLIARDKPTMMSYIHSNMSIPEFKDLGKIYTIKLELHEDIVSLLSNNTSNNENNFNSSNINEKHWIKRIISDNEKNVTAISYNKARYNKIIKDEQRENEELSKQDQPVKSQIIKYLFEKILDEKELTQDDLHFSDVEIKNSIFELVLITYKKKYSKLSIDEIMYDYYDFLIKEEFAKLRFDLEKYYEPKRYKKHIEIIEYYADLFLGDLIKYRDTIFRRCYSLLVVHLNLLKDYILNYFEPDKNVTKDFKAYEKLDWIDDIESFVNFFKDLINRGRILYNGKRDIVKIFQMLIYYINVPDLERLNELLDREVPNIKTQAQIKKVKLHWKTNLTDFAKIFAQIINNRRLLYIGEINMTRIASILCEIFIIIGDKLKTPVTSEGLRKALNAAPWTILTKENNSKQ